MPWFVKHETFTAETAALSVEERRLFIQAHRQWVQQQRAEGRLIHNGFLVDKKGEPGGGGLLIFAANNYQEALDWIRSDPMISQELVIWSLSEWIINPEVSFDLKGDCFAS